MKRLVPVLIGLTALLTACPQPTTPEVDPTTLSFTATGTSNWAATQATPLVDTFNGVTQTIGTLNPDKSVKVEITAAMAKAFKPFPLTTFASRNYQSCNTTAVTATDGANYYRLTAPDFITPSGADAYLVAGTEVTNPDGTITVTRNQFWYLDKDAQVTGTITCSDGNDVMALTLKAGWNRVQLAFTYNPTTQRYSDTKFVVLEYTNTYSGPWMAFTRS